MNNTQKNLLVYAAVFILLTVVITATASFAADNGYGEIVWSFEDGVLEPFYSEDDWGSIRLVLDRDTDRNDGVTPMNKHGKHYLCTVFFDNQTDYDESFTGHIMSPDYLIYDPVVTLKIAGGASNYVAVVRVSDGKILGQASNPSGSGHPFVDVSIDLGGNYTEGERVYIDIVDSTTSSWGFISVDEIRTVGKICEDQRAVTGASALKKATGYTSDVFGEMREIIASYEKNFPGSYDKSGYESTIGELETRWNKLANVDVADNLTEYERLGADISELYSKIALSHPALYGKQLVFVTRNQYKGDHHNTHTMFPSYAGEYNIGTFSPGGAIKLLQTATGEVTTLAASVTGVYRDLEVSSDGSRLLYSFRADAGDSYHIYESTLEGKEITVTKQLTSMSDVDDMDPLYLPNGRIVFSSTRSAKYVMCNRHISANIYRMDADGANIIKITNSTLFERPTDVMSDGRILYDRWEYVDRDFGSAQGIWTVNPDGTLQNTYYGNNTPTGAYIDAQQIPGTNKVIATLSSTHDRPWGGIIVIDRSTATDGRDAVVMTIPSSLKVRIGEPGDGLDIDATTGLSLKYEDPYPLDENTFLVSRQISPGSEKTGIYLVNAQGFEVLLYEDDSPLGAYDVRLLEAADNESFIVSERRNYNDDAGTFFVQDVYKGTHMKGVERGSVAYIRVIESVPKLYYTPSADWVAQGQEFPAVNWHSFEVKRVLGDAPVYEDGSAYFEVPQDAFVYFQLISEDGRMIQSMRSGTLVQSGEKTGCVGCHENAATAPLSASMYQTPVALEKSFTVVDGVGVNVPDKPERYDWMPEGNLNYLTDIQPIFTNNCISCHGYDNPAASLTLVPDKTLVFNASYVDLWRTRSGRSGYYGNLLNVVGGAGTEFTNAKAWGSYVSPLIKKLTDKNDAHSTYLTDSELRAIQMWVDANAPYYGDFSTNYPSNLGGRCPLTPSELASLPGLIYTNAFSSTGAASIYFDNPELSPYLKKFPAGSDAYKKALAIIELGKKRLEENPDVDMEGYQMNETDLWRLKKFEYRQAVEAANRAAEKNGEKRYDSDNTEPTYGEYPAYK